ISIHSEAPSTQKPAVIITASQTLELPALCTPRSPKPDHREHHTRSEVKGVRLLVSGPRFLLEPVARKSGEGGIRTPDAGITDVTVFETAAFNHSATSPRESVPPTPTPFNYHSTLSRTLHEHSLAESSQHNVSYT